MGKRRSLSLLFLPILLGLLAACTAAAPSPTPTGITPTVTESTAEPSSGTTIIGSLIDQATAAPAEEEILQTPTPKPTATPGPLTEAAVDISRNLGIYQRRFLGLAGEDWVNLGVSLLFVLVGFFIIARLLYLFFLLIARWIFKEHGENFLESIRGEIYWLIGTLVIEQSINRLLFVPAEWKQTLNLIFFAIYAVIVTAILWKLIGAGMAYFRETRHTEDELARAPVFLSLIQRVLRGLLVIIAVTVVLDGFGVNVSALLAVLGIGGLALSLAAQDTLSDLINGFLILIDQPFRVGDRIGLQELDTWGDVVEIGTRTTRIRTRNNRMVIVPNSKIGKSLVVNYSYPDQRYRVNARVGIAYGTDLEQARQILIDTVQDVPGVLPNEPVDALLVKLGDSALEFEVLYWINSYTGPRPMRDRVNSAIYKALTEAGIDMPFITYDVNLKLNDEQINRLAPKD